jgi:hypothetical protein
MPDEEYDSGAGFQVKLIPLEKIKLKGILEALKKKKKDGN